MKFVELPAVLDENLVVMAPTGGGKTTAVLNRLEDWLEDFSKIILCFPTKRLMFEVSEKLSKLGIKHLMDNSDARLEKSIDISDWVAARIIVTSYEKADAMIMLFPALAANTVIVIDEVHLAAANKDGKEERSIPILSLMATAKEVKSRIVVMSATIPNYRELAEYLNARVITVNNEINREVRFVELASVPWGGRAYLSTIMAKVAAIINEDKEKSTIVFRISRGDCEAIASMLKANGIKAEVIHAGILQDKQKEIMQKFKKGEVKVIVSTHSLTWGVNTPAERIIIAGLLRYTATGPVINEYVKTTDIAQMAGRAGRPGWSNKAELIAIVAPGTFKYFNEYISEKELIKRGLESNYAEEIGLKGEPETVVLRLVKVGKIKTIDDLMQIPERWFNVPEKERFEEALNNLESYGLVTVDDSGKIKITKLGSVVAESYTDFKTFKAVKKHVIDKAPETRLEKLISLALAAKELRTTRLQIPEEAAMDSVVLAVTDEEAREIIAQFAKVTGDTNWLAESMKNMAFLAAKIYRVLGKSKEDVMDFVILGKTMKRIRSMIWHKVPISGVLSMYVDGKIDQLFVVKEGEKQ